jgi:hypothetical protein
MSKSRIALSLTLFLACSSVFIGTAPSASAAVSSKYCNGRYKGFTVYTYIRPSNNHKYPLRCGTASWGFQHIKSRWNDQFEKMISLTLKNGEIVNDVQQDGGTHVFALMDKRCINLFRVIYDVRADSTKKIFPIGVKSAYYWEGQSVIASSHYTSFTSSNWRTDCRVIQRV